MPDPKNGSRIRISLSDLASMSSRVENKEEIDRKGVTALLS
jgi:hypothetical protein